MDSTLTFQYPIWFGLFCLLIGLVFAVMLYFRDKTFAEASSTQRKFIPFLAILRFLGASSIAFLLLGPLLKKKEEQVQNPSVVIVQDNTESIAAAFKGEDSLNYANGINQLIEELGENIDVKKYIFGEKLMDVEEPDYTGKITNLSSTIDDIYNRFSYQNIGAIVLATDGIYNEGSNPVYSNIKMDIPLYAIALGDTTPTRDLKLDRVLHNSIAYRGDKFTIRVDLSSFNCQGNNTVLNVYSGKGTSNRVYTKSIKLNKERFFTSEDIILEAGQVGIRQFTVSLGKVEGEKNTSNNYQTIYVEVLEGKQKIMILANNPHPDLSALKQSIEFNKNYEAKIQMISKFDGNVSDQNLVILHGLPSTKHDVSSLVKSLKTKNVPALFIMSSSTNLNGLNAVQDIVEIKGASSSMNDVVPIVNSDFNLFTFDGIDLEKIEEFPPLKTPFGEYSVSPTAQVFMNQKIGTVETAYPLFALKQSTSYKTGVLCGEGIWRWRMFDYQKHENQDNFNEIVSKFIQYLAVKNDKRQFRVSIAKNIFNENENILLDGELYNDSYELINEPEARIKLVDSEGKEFPYVFNKTASAYTLDAGILPIGDYRFTGRTVYNGKELKSSGNFTIKELQLESMQTTADHNLLKVLVSNYNGEMVPVSGLSDLATKIKSNKSLTPTLYTSYRSEPIINLKWLFFVIMALLASEWFIRKYNGAY